MIAMKSEKDILKSAPELRNMPYTVPDGYFDRLKDNAMSCVAERKEKTILERLAPYTALAAVFVFLVTAGSFLLRMTTPQTETEFEELYFYSDIMPLTDPYAIEATDIADYEVMEEEIIEYLIYTGTTAEVIELSK